MTQKTAGKIFVRQVRSSARTMEPKVRTLVAMGLGRIGKSTTLPDNKAVRGMIRSVIHWVEVRPV
jgi:ribosomal protein L30